MGISIKNERAERLARELARETGESLTTAISKALEERLQRVEGRRSAADKLALARAALRHEHDNEASFPTTRRITR